MKHAFLLVLIVAGYCYGQYNEFKTYPNGLIYDEQTMNRLGVIVDSLNIRFRSCDLTQPYYSFSQGMATWVEIPNKTARKLIEDGITLEEYKQKFPRSVKQENLWVIKSTYENYNGVSFIEYSGLPFGWNNEPSIHVKNKEGADKTSGWVLDNEDAFYLKKLERKELPYEYARLVQYVDCMIDPNAQIYFPNAKESVYQQVVPRSKAHQFVEWAQSYPGEPKLPDYEKIDEQDWDSVYGVYYAKRMTWDSLRMLHLDEQMKTSGYWNKLLSDAVNESLATGNSDRQFEFYVARYGSKEDALKLMRSRKVIGNCSQDQSPRFHAMNICQLAAETTKWDIFLRSHLDIMNDRFERMSDGSYAWEGRKTYLKELEELDINAIDLLLGTCLRVENVSNNHYFGSIGRVGRALTDATEKESLEQNVLTMIHDERLDPYNRLLMAYLLSSYVYHVDANRKTDISQKLETAVASLPEFVKEVWHKE